jgi:hypothetical protein
MHIHTVPVKKGKENKKVEKEAVPQGEQGQIKSLTIKPLIKNATIKNLVSAEFLKKRRTFKFIKANEIGKVVKK